MSMKASGAKRKKMGRPPTTGLSPTITMRFSREKIAELKAWAQQNNTKSLSDAIRQLVDLGLTAKRKRE
jgi:hypothetical protein